MLGVRVFRKRRGKKEKKKRRRSFAALALVIGKRGERGDS